MIEPGQIENDLIFERHQSNKLSIDEVMRDDQ